MKQIEAKIDKPTEKNFDNFQKFILDIMIDEIDEIEGEMEEYKYNPHTMFQHILESDSLSLMDKMVGAFLIGVSIEEDSDEFNEFVEYVKGNTNEEK